MIVICNNYKKCTSLTCIHKIEHIKDKSCEKGDCGFTIATECEMDIKEKRKEKLKKINESHL